MSNSNFQIDGPMLFEYCTSNRHEYCDSDRPSARRIDTEKCNFICETERGRASVRNHHFRTQRTQRLLSQLCLRVIQFMATCRFAGACHRVCPVLPASVIPVGYECRCSIQQQASVSSLDVANPTMHLRGGAFVSDSGFFSGIGQGSAKICSSCRNGARFERRAGPVHGDSVDESPPLNTPKNLLHQYRNDMAVARLRRPPKLSRSIEVN